MQMKKAVSLLLTLVLLLGVFAGITPSASACLLYTSRCV